MYMIAYASNYQFILILKIVMFSVADSYIHIIYI